MLTPGIPTVRDYQILLQSDSFSSMESFSNDFLLRHKQALAGYQRKWVADPLHQWSRQWEYPFVFSRIFEYADGRSPIHVLDAGSGVTFFPYYLKARIPGCKVTCIDRDPLLKAVHDQISAAGSAGVVFSRNDLHHIPCRSASFDVVYCVSVLEHTDNYEPIVAEFRRILKPGGLLVVTFDLAVRGHADISPERAAVLLMTLDRYFPTRDVELCRNLPERARAADILTTEYARILDKRLLPWRYPWLTALKSLTRLRFPRASELTVFCCALNA